MRFNWFYTFIVLFALLLVFVSLKYFRGSRYSSVGIAYAREYNINAEKAAVVKSIPVVSGQLIKKGDLLIVLTSTEMDFEIEKLQNRIEVLTSQRGARAKLSESRISFIRAEQGVVISDLKSTIMQTESEIRLNNRLTRQYASSNDTSARENPVRVKLDALKQQLVRQEQAMDIQIRDVVQQNETEQKVLAGEIDLLSKELDLLRKQRGQLDKYATADGVVGNIYVRQGEQVNAFTSLLSIHPKNPSTVVGYMVGRKEELPVGAPVTVQSFEENTMLANGKIIGYGAFVQLPEILQKSTATKAFGREMFIEIPSGNEFASGEKVLIR
jgi:multidrug resistance efflux pump